MTTLDCRNSARIQREYEDIHEDWRVSLFSSDNDEGTGDKIVKMYQGPAGHLRRASAHVGLERMVQITETGAEYV